LTHPNLLFSYQTELQWNSTLQLLLFSDCISTKVMINCVVFCLFRLNNINQNKTFVFLDVHFKYLEEMNQSLELISQFKDDKPTFKVLV